MIFEGAIAVKAALEAAKRECRTLYIAKGKAGPDVRYIRSLAVRQGVAVEVSDPAQLRLRAAGSTYGGILLEAGSRRKDQLEPILAKSGPLFLAYLEGVEDPWNFGYALRTLYAAGADALITPAREWGAEEAVIAKSSAGAYDRMAVLELEADTLARLKARGVQIIIADRRDAEDFYQAELTGDLLIALGGPLRGLARPVATAADRRVYIPYARDFHNALNLTAATAVMAYEVYRQRHEKMF